MQVGHDGSLLNYHGPSEQEAAVRLFDTSERPLSALAGRLLKSLANDQCQTRRTSASRSTSGWWNGQPVEEETRNTAFPGPNVTSTPQKQPHQAGDVPQPIRPSNVTTPVFNQENCTITKSRLMMPGGRATDVELQRPSFQEQQHVSSTRLVPQGQHQHQQPIEPRQEVAGGDSAWLTHSSWADEPALRLQATRSLDEERPPSPSFDVTLEEDQILSEHQPMMSLATDSMMLGNFSPPSNLLSQFVSQDVEEEEEEVDGNSPNVLAKVGHPKRPAALPLPVPKRKPTFSAPFKRNNNTSHQ